MSTDGMDPGILSDFLTEAGELVDTVAGDIMALEAQADDAEALNRVFRAFHTVKGGAGFLGLEPMVAICHRAEDLLGAARQGEVPVHAGLIDALSRALSVVESMLTEVGAGRAPSPAEEAVLKALEDARHVDGSKAASDEISDDEFEALLDALHGSGGVPGEKPVAEMPVAAPAPVIPPKPPAAKTAAKTSAEAPAPASAEPMVRVESQRLDQLMALVGELVLVRNRLKAQDASLDEAARRAVSELDHVAVLLQRAVMRVRMQPVGRLFARVPRMVRELARGLGKDVVVSLSGEDAELDKQMLDALADPLVHLVRNSLDHGIEDAPTRSSAGKPARGSLSLSARQAGDHIEILIEDDGRGMDPAKIRASAVAKGVIDAETANRLDATASLELIFRPGFSTRTEVSDVSGRGVGMDVVRSRIVELGGSVSLSSEPGNGTQVRLSLPLTLAVLPALMVRVGEQVHALPLAEIRELTPLPLASVERVGRRWQVPQRDRVLPLVFLGEWTGAGAAAPHAGLIVQVRIGGQPWGLVVDAVIGREDVVVRPLSRGLRQLAGYAGATVTGAGRVALVLDPEGLVRSANAAPVEMSTEDMQHG
jgi:two-component system chemotaxis sensor kinase CheA